MKHSEADKWIRQALWAVQKVRSDMNELSGTDLIMRKIELDLFPKIMDDRWLLNPLLKLVEQLDNKNKLTPMDFYNIMTIIEKWTGDILDVVIILATDKIEGFPKPDLLWLKGWDLE